MARPIHVVELFVEELPARHVFVVREERRLHGVARATVEVELPIPMGPDALVGRPARLQSGLKGEPPRVFGGVITEATLLTVRNDYALGATYRLVIESGLA